MPQSLSEALSGITLPDADGRQIRQHLEERGLEGAGPAQIAAHRTRDAKATLGPHEMLARHREVVKLVTGRIHLEGGVATYDLADLGVDTVNKFIAYAADAATLYTVSVSRGASRSKISLGSNPWRQQDRRHNLAQIAERYGGGGHPAVAAISFKPDDLEKARSTAATITEELRR